MSKSLFSSNVEEKLRIFYLVLAKVAKKHSHIIINLDKREGYYCNESGEKISDEEYEREYGNSPTEQTWKDIYNDFWGNSIFWGEGSEFYLVLDELKRQGFEVGIDLSPPDAAFSSLVLKINDKWFEVGTAETHYEGDGETYWRSWNIESIHEPEYVLPNLKRLEKISKNVMLL